MKEIFAGLMKFMCKMSAKIILAAVCMVSSFILFVPDSLLNFFDLQDVRNAYKSTISLVFLVATTILLLLFITWVWNCIWNFVRSRLVYSGHDAKRRINAVGDWNKSLIRQLYEKPSHSQKLPLQNANVQALLSENIIINSPLGDMLGFECVLQPWVVKYLDEHPDYLSSIKRFDKPFTIELPFL